MCTRGKKRRRMWPNAGATEGRDEEVWRPGGCARFTEDFIPQHQHARILFFLSKLVNTGQKYVYPWKKKIPVEE